MDLEQRIGRHSPLRPAEHRADFTIWCSPTLLSSIFLLLDTKLTEIGRALGKVDERGQICRRLAYQILGQLSMQVNYASLYADALSDPELNNAHGSN